MRKYLFSSLSAVVGGVALLCAAEMLPKACEPTPLPKTLIEPGRFTPKELGPNFDDAIRAMGGDPADISEPQ